MDRHEGFWPWKSFAYAVGLRTEGISIFRDSGRGGPGRAGQTKR
jgi:hypothetical protein